jgi:hypothetical protein
MTVPTLPGLFSLWVRRHSLSPAARVLRPGGIAGISISDWIGTLIAPPDSAVRDTIRRFTELQQDNGGNPYACCLLGEWMEAVGFSRIRLCTA